MLAANEESQQQKEGSDRRSQLLSNAIKFLQDNQVRNSSITKQIEFLESKGLSRAEIDEAMRLAGIPAPVSSAASPPPLPTTPPPRLDSMITQMRKFDWGRFALIIALIGSASVALSQSVLFKSVYRLLSRLKRRVLGGTTEDKDEVGRLRKEVSLMNQMLASVQESIKAVQERFKIDLDSIKASQNYHYAELGRDIEEVREEARHHRQQDQVQASQQ